MVKAVLLLYPPFKFEALPETQHKPIQPERLNITSADVLDSKSGVYGLAIRDHQETEALKKHTESKSLEGIKRLVVIGDSLSDSHGRMKSKTLGLMLSSRQYHEGRFTNGFVWPDFISSDAYLKSTLKTKMCVITSNYSIMQRVEQ